MLGKKF